MLAVMNLSANFFILLIAAILSSPSTPRVSRSVEIVAHRGASFDAPENTVAAANLAWAQSADAVETDIRLTSDGELIVSHDSTTKGINGRDTAIADLTFAEARSLDAGRRKGSKFAGERMPTLDELIATVPAGRRLFVEIKTGPEILPALEKSLSRTRATPRNIVLISFNFDVLREAHRRWPKYTTLWLLAHDSSSPSIDSVIDRSTEAGLSGLDLQSGWPLDSRTVNRIKAAHLQLHVWTVDDPEVAQRWIDLGVDGVTTNRAGWMREQIAI